MMDDDGWIYEEWMMDDLIDWEDRLLRDVITGGVLPKLTDRGNLWRQKEIFGSVDPIRLFMC